MPGIGEALKASADELEAVVLADLQARAGGLAAAWCESLPALLASPDWNVTINYASELASLKKSPIGYAPQAGRYTCTNYDYGTLNGTLAGQSDSYNFDLFADGWYSLSTSAPPYPGGLFEFPDDVGRYQILPFEGRVVWLSGFFAKEIGNAYLEVLGTEPTTYALEEDGSLRFRLEVDTTDLTDCVLVGPTLSEPPEAVLARAENIETYLRDPKFTNPLPEGAGGLSGLYSGSSQPIYFLPEGYFYQGSLHWGYDVLKDVCSRVGQPGEPFGGEPVCETYVINGDTITLSYWDDADYSADGDAPVTLPFRREGEGVRIGGDAYFPVAPAQDARFDGIYSTSSGDFLGGFEYKVALTPEGDFQYSEDSFVNSAFLAATFQDSNYNEGSYAINGYTLTLHLAGGLELSYNFYLDPENPDGFYLLGNPYTLGRKLQ